MFKYTYWIYNNAVPKETCENIIKQNDWSKKKQAVIGDSGHDRVNLRIRTTNVLWHDNQSELMELVQPYFLDANRAAGWDFNIERVGQIQIGEYEVNGHYDWHVDSHAPDEQNNQRKLSMSILLNDEQDFEGGEFEFKDIKPNLTQGSIIVFPSFIYHRVAPVTKGVRYSAVAWATGPAFK